MACMTAFFAIVAAHGDKCRAMPSAHETDEVK
jgi:hypothetical protein